MAFSTSTSQDAVEQLHSADGGHSSKNWDIAELERLLEDATRGVRSQSTYKPFTSTLWISVRSERWRENALGLDPHNEESRNKTR